MSQASQQGSDNLYLLMHTDPATTDTHGILRTATLPVCAYQLVLPGVVMQRPTHDGMPDAPAKVTLLISIAAEVGKSEKLWLQVLAPFAIGGAVFLSHLVAVCFHPLTCAKDPPISPASSW